MTILSTGKIDYVVSTSAKGRIPTPGQRPHPPQGRGAQHPLPHQHRYGQRTCAFHQEPVFRGKHGAGGYLPYENGKDPPFLRQDAGVRANDYIYFDCMDAAAGQPGSHFRALFPTGITASAGDGIVEILPSKVADARMRMYNSDGTEGLMAGNAIRCVAKFLYDHGFVEKMEMTIETASGVKRVWLA